MISVTNILLSIFQAHVHIYRDQRNALQLGLGRTCSPLTPPVPIPSNSAADSVLRTTSHLEREQIRVAVPRIWIDHGRHFRTLTYEKLEQGKLN